MTETVSTFPEPPKYYKDFDVPNFNLAPPAPIKGEFWSNGYIRDLNAPFADYVGSGYPLMFNEQDVDKDSDSKVILLKQLFHHLLRKFKSLMEIIDKKQNNDTIIDSLRGIETISMNIVRLLNIMRLFQLRENLIRGLKYQITEKQQKLELIDSKIAEAKSVLNKCQESLQQIPHVTVSNETPVSETKVNESHVVMSLMTDLKSLLSDNYSRMNKETEEHVSIALEGKQTDQILRTQMEVEDTDTISQSQTRELSVTDPTEQMLEFNAFTFETNIFNDEL